MVKGGLTGSDLQRRHSGAPQANRNLEIPGSMLRIAPE